MASQKECKQKCSEDTAAQKKEEHITASSPNEATKEEDVIISSSIKSTKEETKIDHSDIDFFEDAMMNMSTATYNPPKKIAARKRKK